jgi:hypothetical protein
MAFSFGRKRSDEWRGLLWLWLEALLETELTDIALAEASEDQQR